MSDKVLAWLLWAFVGLVAGLLCWLAAMLYIYFGWAFT